MITAPAIHNILQELKETCTLFKKIAEEAEKGLQDLLPENLRLLLSKRKYQDDCEVSWQGRKYYITGIDFKETASSGKLFYKTLDIATLKKVSIPEAEIIV